MLTHKWTASYFFSVCITVCHIGRFESDSDVFIYVLASIEGVDVFIQQVDTTILYTSRTSILLRRQRCIVHTHRVPETSSRDIWLHPIRVSLVRCTSVTMATLTHVDATSTKNAEYHPKFTCYICQLGEIMLWRFIGSCWSFCSLPAWYHCRYQQAWMEKSKSITWRLNYDHPNMVFIACKVRIELGSEARLFALCWLTHFRAILGFRLLVNTAYMYVFLLLIP